MNTAPVKDAQLQVRDLLMGFVVSRAVQVAAELGIADALAHGALDSARLAAKTGTHANTLVRLMRYLETYGIFEQRADGRYANTPMSEFLRDNVQGSLRGLSMMFGDALIWRAWEGLGHSVRTSEAAFSHVHGAPMFDYLANHPASATCFDAAMVSSSNMLNSAIVDAYDWKQFSVLVDIGGGVGSTLAAVVEATPDLRGVLFDLPHVIERGRDFLAQRGLSGRCLTMPGSFFDSVPQGGDAFLLKHILHDWSDGDCISILHACRNAMPDHAKLLVCEKVILPGNERSYSKLMDLVMLTLTEGGRERTQDGFANLFMAAGLRLLRIIPTRGDNSILEAVTIG